jgi:FkbM family methyltransferase
MDFMLIDFSDLIKKYNMNISGIIHIGAHYGEEIHDYINNDIKKIVAFEPLVENYSILQDNIRRLGIDVETHQTALGSSSGETLMYVSSNQKQSSSILKPKVHLTQHPNVFFDTTENVTIKTLDEFNIDGCNFINMDVQGYELEVLKGSKDTLNDIDYVYCEVNRDELYENNAYIEEIDDFLSRYNMIRVETDWSGVTWGDALYIKSDSIQKHV